jgi:polysaccharide export outer membrane protein
MHRLIFTVLCVVLFSTACTLKFMRDEEPAASKKPTPALDGTPRGDTDRASLQPGVIGPGDILQITVYGEKELTNLYQVSPEGVIVFPFVGETTVKGMTNFSLAERIAERLREGYVRNPQVHVLVKEFNSRRVFVLGQVKNAGKFSIIHEMTIVEAISVAGGFTNFADINNVVVTRKDESGKEVRFVLNMEEILAGKANNFYLLPGDIVFVQERFF